jgi:hypothetical protein
MKRGVKTHATTTNNQDWGIEMLRFFKKQSPRHARPAHRLESPQPLSAQDHAVAAWNGITDQMWANLPALVKVDLRESYFSARGFR